MLVRRLVIILSLSSTYSFSDENSSSNSLEDLIRLKQQLILEHMAGDGETRFQRSIRDNLDLKNEGAANQKPQRITVEGSLTQEMIHEFEQHYKTPESCEIWKNNTHMVECINHKMRSRNEFFKHKGNRSNSVVPER